MKFCKFCGKQLADDEVCSCQEGKTSQTAIKESPITQIVNLVKGTLDKPESAAKNFYYKGSIAATGILVGVLTLTFILATLFNMIHASVVYHKYLDGAFVSGEMVVKVIFFPIVYIIVMAIAYFYELFIHTVGLIRSLCAGESRPVTVTAIGTQSKLGYD